MRMNETLSIKVYGPALAGDDERPVAAVRALERALPGLLLEWTVTDDHRILQLPQRDAWLARASSEGRFPLVCNNDESAPVLISGSHIPAASGPGGQGLLDVQAQLPLDARSIAVARDMLGAVAEAAGALWGHATPFRASAEIAAQTIHPRMRELPPRGLPALKHPEELQSPAVPHRLGWLNYWSATAAQVIGFPDSGRDAELLAQARRTATGWVVQLTETPLELDIPAHLEALLQAYERFPEIGGRAAR